MINHLAIAMGAVNSVTRLVDIAPTALAFLSAHGVDGWSLLTRREAGAGNAT
jgi:hypothetical protein